MSGTFFDELMASERAPKRKQTLDPRGGDGADDDRFYRSGRSATVGRSLPAFRGSGGPPGEVEDGGMLHDFEADFRKSDLSFRPDPASRPMPVRTDAEGRDDEHRKLLAAHEEERQKTRYLHVGHEVSDTSANDWSAHLWSRMFPGKVLDPSYRKRAKALWDETEGGTMPPVKGWDEPKVGRFRSAMSWLGNKLTFGRFGGKDYRARQEALAKRRGIVEHAFANRQQYFDERFWDLKEDPESDQHKNTREELDKKYGSSWNIGRAASPGSKDRRKRPEENPRYNNARPWLKDSAYGRDKWERLAAKDYRGRRVRGLLKD